MNDYLARMLVVTLCLVCTWGCGNNDAQFQEAMDKGKAAFVSGTSQEKRQEALDLFTRAIALKPDSALAYLSRGHAYIKNSDMQKAFNDYDKAAALDPTMAHAYYHRALARIALQSKDERAIIQDLQKALELDSSIAAAGTLLMLYEKKDSGSPF
ncbi:MAG: tetratricopeptide repeat protein [Desulfatibacillum sp.]|nr:tetratricopeptide repeat protein [Desulfatibacillum sp.]